MNKIIGNNIKTLRQKNNFTQDDIVKFLGINRSTYSNYELGLRETPLWILEKLSDLFGCDTYMFFETDQMAFDNMLISTFRVEDVSEVDMKEIAYFKGVVKSYIKITQLLK